MSLKTIATIAIPGSAGSSFDHGAFDPASCRVFVAHTGRSCVEVIDHDGGKHVATLADFPEAAGVVADDGMVLVTNRGAASLAWVDARSLETRRVFKVGPRPNGVAIVARQKLAIAACIGDETHGPTLHVVGLDERTILNRTSGPAAVVRDRCGRLRGCFSRFRSPRWCSRPGCRTCRT